MNSNNRFPFQFIRRKTRLAAEILTGVCIVKLGSDYILWI